MSWRDWSACAEGLRRAGWSEAGVRRVLFWARRAWPRAEYAHFTLLLAAGLEVQERSKQYPGSIPDWPQYLIAWASRNGNHGLWDQYPRDEWRRAGKASFEARVAEQGGVVPERYRALLGELFKVGSTQRHRDTEPHRAEQAGVAS